MDYSINGYGTGKIIIDSSTSLTPSTTEITLPRTNAGGGLKEVITVDKIRHVVQSLDIANPVKTKLQKITGLDMRWEFYYADWVKGNDLLEKFYPVIRAAIAGTPLKLYPRVDVERWYWVLLANDSIELMLKKATAANVMHKGFTIVFEVAETQTDPGWIKTPSATVPTVSGVVLFG